MQNTPHSWAAHTLQCFPPVLNTFFAQNSTPKENKQLLKKSVEDEYQNWSQMTNENDIIAHFTAPSTPPLFLCLLFKMMLDTDNIDPVAYKWVPIIKTTLSSILMIRISFGVECWKESVPVLYRLIYGNCAITWCMKWPRLAKTITLRSASIPSTHSFGTTMCSHLIDWPFVWRCAHRKAARHKYASTSFNCCC